MVDVDTEDARAFAWVDEDRVGKSSTLAPGITYISRAALELQCAAFSALPSSPGRARETVRVDYRRLL